MSVSAYSGMITTSLTSRWRPETEIDVSITSSASISLIAWHQLCGGARLRHVRDTRRNGHSDFVGQCGLKIR